VCEREKQGEVGFGIQTALPCCFYQSSHFFLVVAAAVAPVVASAGGCYLYYFYPPQTGGGGGAVGALDALGNPVSAESWFKVRSQPSE